MVRDYLVARNSQRQASPGPLSRNVYVDELELLNMPGLRSAMNSPADKNQQRVHTSMVEEEQLPVHLNHLLKLFSEFEMNFR